MIRGLAPGGAVEPWFSSVIGGHRGYGGFID